MIPANEAIANLARLYLEPLLAGDRTVGAALLEQRLERRVAELLGQLRLRSGRARGLR